MADEEDDEERRGRGDRRPRGAARHVEAVEPEAAAEEPAAEARARGARRGAGGREAVEPEAAAEEPAAESPSLTRAAEEASAAEAAAARGGPPPPEAPSRASPRSSGARSRRASGCRARSAARTAKPKREQPAERKPIVRLPKPERERGRRQERRGVVVSDAMDKTIVVKVDTIKAHPKYKKVVRRSAKFHAHDEQNDAKVGRRRPHRRDAPALEDEALAAGRDRRGGASDPAGVPAAGGRQHRRPRDPLHPRAWAARTAATRASAT